MASSSTKVKKGLEMLVHGEWKASDFKLMPVVAETLDLSGAQSQIPPKVLLVNDIHSHFKGTIQELGTLEIDVVCDELCVDGVLKSGHKHLEEKGLTHITHLPRGFQIKWIRYILSQVHEGKIWLEKLVEITKKMIHQITGLPMLVKDKSTKTLGRVELEKKTLAEWDGRGMKINSITDSTLR